MLVAASLVEAFCIEGREAPKPTANNRIAKRLDSVAEELQACA
ncbi:MAG: hypothetical protein AABO57_03135 [Acidobacteriota bacterium]